MIGLRTIRRGERFAIWNRRGEIRIAAGPCLISTFGRQIQPLPQYAARPDQFLQIKFRDGRIEHVTGPATLWLDPVAHDAVRIIDAVQVKAGEAVMVTVPAAVDQGKSEEEKSSLRRIVEGPAQFVPDVNELVEPLEQFRAGPEQYLSIEYLDGRREHVAGPAASWLDPLFHASIKVGEVIDIDANHALVVYRHEKGFIKRRIINGPNRFMPLAEEWLHEFRWHGADPKNPVRKIPRGLQFHKLRKIPDQMYHDVESVRTSDDALLVVRLMVFFELFDAEKMLDQTHDPIADFINAASADVIHFVAALNFHEFKEQTDKLNDLTTYGTLVQRAERIGFRISKVVYRGYQASDKLQAMHDSAIEARTQLCLESETERQTQDLQDMRLGRERERAAKRQEMDREETEHKNRLLRLTHEEQRRVKEAEERQTLEIERQQGEIKLSHRREADTQQLHFLRTIREMQVDLSRYLIAQFQNPDRLIKIDSNQEPKLHLHEN